MSKLNKKRNEQIYKLRKENPTISFRELGEVFKIGKQTAYDIYKKELKRKELSPV